MNLEKEIANAQKTLLIPVSHLEFEPTYVTIYSGGININTLSYYTVSSIITYDASESNVNKLNWEAVYRNNLDVIHQKAEGISSDEIESITIDTFSRILIKYKNDRVIAAKCIYRDGAWSVYEEKKQ